MAKKKNRLTETEIGLAVLQIMASSAGGKASVRTIVKEIPNYLKLTEDDHAASETRTNEEIWEQQVRNLVSHKTTPGNMFAEGHAIQASKGVWQITDAGKLYLKHKGF
jgi:hypothetical protein